MKDISRRKFVKSAVTATAVAAGASLQAQAPVNRVSGYDHVALPMLNTDVMVAFYRKLGFEMRENVNAVSVYIGRSMINFHRPTRWQDSKFTLRAPAAAATSSSPSRRATSRKSVIDETSFSASLCDPINARIGAGCLVTACIAVTSRSRKIG